MDVSPNLVEEVLGSLNPNLLAAEQERRSIENETKSLASFKNDPYGFVMWAWTWGQGSLQHSAGPDEYQKQFLIDLGEATKERAFDGHTPVQPIMMSISSAHGVGKSTMWAWITWWILSTRPGSIGTVTAGTYQQLEERTWAEIMHWGRLCRTGNEFDIQASGVFRSDPLWGEKWKVTPKTARKENAQSFAGQHAQTATSFFIFDEASEVPDENWYPSYAGLTDGEPMFFCGGQMLQTSGEFYNVCFGDASSRWDTRVWHGENSRFTNKQLIADWKEEHGEDSDWFRVRVMGLPPRASSLQFIGQDIVNGARKREHRALPDEPLIVGFDAANGGLAKFVITFRRGLDAKSIAPITMAGSTARDVVVAKLCEIMGDRRPERKVAALFGDQAFGAVILERVRQSGFTNVFEVNFGDPSPSIRHANMRAYMWDQMKEWLTLGAIPDDERMAQQFLGPGFSHNQSGKLLLESKQNMAKRGVHSPDYPDSLATTFYRKVAPMVREEGPRVVRARFGGAMSWAR